MCVTVKVYASWERWYMDKSYYTDKSLLVKIDIIGYTSNSGVKWGTSKSGISGYNGVH